MKWQPSLGAIPDPDGTQFRGWAPEARRVDVMVHGVGVADKAWSKEGQVHAMSRGDEGMWSACVTGLRPGARYRYRLDGERLLPDPDPASRWQPEGPHGPSEVVDPSAFAWSDGAWQGVTIAGQVLYEMHIGTFTAEGSWTAAMRQLAELRGAGVTCLEVMPIADFAGSFGWGYDGVDLFAPTRLYGRPNDFRRFVEQSPAVDAGAPATVLADGDRHDLVACGIEGADDGRGGAERDLVLARSSTVEDADSHPRHGEFFTSTRREDKQRALDRAVASLTRNRAALEAGATRLIEREALTRDELPAVIPDEPSVPSTPATRTVQLAS
jgi:hypothetical protein